MSMPVLPKRWWLLPLIVASLFIGSIITAWQVSDTAKELLAKSFFTMAGTLATPFILETSFAIIGLVLVLVFNEWRRLKDGPDWVEMEVKSESNKEPKNPNDA